MCRGGQTLQAFEAFDGLGPEESLSLCLEVLAYSRALEAATVLMAQAVSEEPLVTRLLEQVCCVLCVVSRGAGGQGDGRGAVWEGLPAQGALQPHQVCCLCCCGCCAEL